MREFRSKSILATVGLAAVISACDPAPTTAPVTTGEAQKVAADKKAADSASQASGVTTATVAPPSNVTTISLKAGDKITVTVQSNECSGNPETVNVYGVISGSGIIAGTCAGGLVGQTVTLGPASTDGTIWFTATHQALGEGAPAPVTGSRPDYVAYLDDGASCCDYNDVVISVHIATEPGTLACTPQTLTRGQNVSCKVTGTGIVVKKWTFVGQAYNNPNTVWKLEVPATSNTWQGTAVISGDVSAQATVNGVPRSQPLTASFTVQQRTGTQWSWGPGQHWKHTRGAIGADPGCFLGDSLLYGHMVYFGRTARTKTCDDDTLTPSPFATTTGGYSVKQVTAGPNAGFWYVSAITYQMLMWSIMNPVMTSGSSVKFTLTDPAEKSLCSAAAGQSVTQANWYFFNKTCKNANADGMIAGVWNHEEYGCCGGNGHEAQLERVAQLPEFELYRNLEAVYAADILTSSDQAIRQSVIDLARGIVNGMKPSWEHPTANVTGNYAETLWFRDVTAGQFVSFFVHD